MSLKPQRYDRSRSYDWNYENAPAIPHEYPVSSNPGHSQLCGVNVASPIAIAAGPLLNGRWILHYAALGFDVLTYKTVRSQARSCYDPPNLQPVETTKLDGSMPDALVATDDMSGSWAVSFGMPSKPPEVWRRDVEVTRARLPMEKKLSVSVVATPEADWTIEQIADDYARCAGWAVESGADFVELNCSCPNVSTSDGQLYQNAEATGVVADRVREAIGEIPLLIKIGHITDPSLARELIVRLGRTVNALVMVNCLAAKVESRHGVLFSGQPRGIAGHAIREAALAQIRLFRGIVNKTDSTLELVGVGGISSSSDVRNHLREGASGVQVATSAMLSDRIEIAL